MSENKPPNDTTEEQRESQPKSELTVEMGTIQRLRRRAQAGEETYHEVVKRLLDETAETVSLEDVVECIQEEFDHIVSLDVDHLGTHESPTELTFWVYSGEAMGPQDVRELFDSNYLVDIERQEKPDIQIPFYVIGTQTGPKGVDTPEKTTIYMVDDVIGGEPVSLDDGLEYIEEKLARPEEWESSQESLTDSVQIGTDT